MKLEQVKKLDPMERLIYWIREREKVRLAKEAGNPKPWTDDEILQKFKFCNVRRMDDRVSRWLLDNWYEPFYGHGNMVTACTLARFLNNPQSLAHVGFPKRWDPIKVRTTLEERQREGLKNFSGAYLITGSLGGTKIEQVVLKIVEPLHRARLSLGDSLEETVTLLSSRMGIGSFLAGQIACDLRWATPHNWEDLATFAPMGPGSRRGLNRVRGLGINSPLNHNQFREHFPWFVETVSTRIPNQIANRLEAIDYQNCLCEFDKYERVLWETGRPKSRYPGV